MERDAPPKVSEFLSEHFGSFYVSERSDGGHEYVLDACPFCGGRRKLWINARTMRWACYKCPPQDSGSAEGGRFTTLLTRALGMRWSEAHDILERLSRDDLARSVDDLLALSGTYGALRHEVKSGLEYPPHGFVPIFDREHRRWNIPDYLRQRGIRLRTARTYELGFCLCGRYAQRLVFPFNVMGETLYFQARDMTGKRDDKYTGPTGSKGGAVFGLDQAVGARAVIVVEGPTDVTGIHQKELPHGLQAIAVAGKTIARPQIATLVQAGFECVFVMMDGEAPEATERIARALSVAIPTVYAAFLPETDDPDSASRRDVLRVLSRAERTTSSPPIGRDEDDE